MDPLGIRESYMGRPAVRFNDWTHVIVGIPILLGRIGDFDYFEDSATLFRWKEEVR